MTRVRRPITINVGPVRITISRQRCPFCWQEYRIRDWHCRPELHK